ncbi:hypothetical protein SAMN06265219_11431 [Gracilimonas mengyeensis]|uniref:P pilus assembly protein, chaperone PapD n=2 Tax=Gracilimonas mengyeensis TaxID=1302730 RepID=A0A521EXT6_9BACT|nr:hypothetical protein SAMN06265219_11431 [Gracilimonas mengyeensis]
MEKVLKRYIFLVMGVFIATNAYSQVAIAPTNLFIDANSNFATYLVINNSQENQEISVDFLFGYTSTDSLGIRSLVFDDSTTASEYSLVEYMRAFPQDFTLNPGRRQVVRIRVNPPANLDEKTYWARIRTSSNPVSPPVEVESSDNVTARVGINIQQISGIFLKKGEVSTGIEVEEIRPLINNDSLIVLADFQRLGNSPFLGTITTQLKDDSGNVVKENVTSTTLYFDGTHREELTIDDIESGNYTIEIQYETRRSDIPADELVQMQPVTATTTVTIP